jgi:hypothetical protein
MHEPGLKAADSAACEDTIEVLELDLQLSCCCLRLRGMAQLSEACKKP